MKKAWYKKWWGILLIALSLVIVTAGSTAVIIDISHQANENSQTDESNSSSEDSGSVTDTDDSSSDDTSTEQEYVIGDQIAYKNGLSFTVDNVEYYNGNDMDTPDSGKHFVIIKVTLDNGSDDKWDYNELDFHLNANGDSSDTDEYIDEGPYSNLNKLNSGSLDPGASKTAYLIGQAPTDATDLQLRYQYNFRSDELSVNLS